MPSGLNAIVDISVLSQKARDGRVKGCELTRRVVVDHSTIHRWGPFVVGAKSDGSKEKRRRCKARPADVLSWPARHPGRNSASVHQARGLRALTRAAHRAYPAGLIANRVRDVDTRAGGAFSRDSNSPRPPRSGAARGSDGARRG